MATIQSKQVSEGVSLVALPIEFNQPLSCSTTTTSAALDQPNCAMYGSSIWFTDKISLMFIRQDRIYLDMTWSAIGY